MRIFFHFSDFHIGISLRKVPFGIWFGKRAMGGANLLAGRRHNFAYAAGKPAAPVRFKNEQQVDLVICRILHWICNYVVSHCTGRL